MDAICFGEEKNADGDKLDKIEKWKSSFDKSVEDFIKRIRNIN